ncbi:GNAT family N-acetyltransferase [Aldersonia kunmingensis]|uniref:GNAT family N-acetyltransferase n=1 Tax=Aldersonia kunmingensis TaxID=408066 RepID=UPI00082FAE45|nr:N-acetyltransferase [Aldersonia kunmingensis]
MLIRRETPADAIEIDRVHRAAFDGDEPAEVALVRQMRDSGALLTNLSFVTQADGRIVGHIAISRARIGDVPVLALGPIGVLPELQRGGVGAALMYAAIGAADAQDESLIGLLGHLEYYPRFGFVLGSEVGVAPDEASWTSHFQVRTLTAWTPNSGGTFRYADEFYSL